MKFHVLTLFPDMIREAAAHSIIGRAVASGLVEINTVNIRDFAVNRHGQVDDSPYGGGAGMVMMAQPVYDAYLHVTKGLTKSTDDASTEQSAHNAKQGFETVLKPTTPANSDAAPQVLYFSPQGKVLTQKKAQELSREKEIILICGHYEGLDERVIEEIVTEEISVGDYVLTGGELPALVLIDAVSRLIPGVLGKAESFQNESFSMSAGNNGSADNTTSDASIDTALLLEHPHYTRPAVFRGREVPEVLLSGHHGNIEKWRHEQAVARTKEKRPDLCCILEATSKNPAEPIFRGCQERGDL